MEAARPSDLARSSAASRAASWATRSAAGVGNTAATIAGTVGGAVVGNQIEQANERDRYRVIVRLDSGGSVALTQVGQGELRVGDRVRIVNSRVYRY